MKSEKEIKQKIKINKNDINLDGESEDYRKGFKAGLEWVLE